MRIFRIFGIRRSGNHAIIEWLASHFEHVEHFNDCIGWENYTYFQKEEYGDLSKPIDCRIISYEDFEPAIEELLVQDCYVIFRDYYNIAASRIQSSRGLDTACPRHKKNHTRSLREVWLKYAELYLKYEHKFILFNFWATSDDYRKNLSSNLNISNSKFTNELPKSKIGGGSSFGDKKINSKLINYRYLLISKKLKTEWENISADQEINRYCEKIFNLKPKEKFLGHKILLKIIHKMKKYLDNFRQ